MSATAGFLVEDFLEAVAAQLDRTQDALRTKAVNRPLTFAVKDFAIDLNVFVELDSDGEVRFRPANAGENGASMVKIGFTTITRPMIEENTVGLELTQGASLEEYGLAPQERRKLERLGVRTGGQLRNYARRTGDDGLGLSRLSGISTERLKNALQMSRPRLDSVRADPGPAMPPPGAPLPGPRQLPLETEPPLPPDASAAPPLPEVHLLPGARRLRLDGAQLVENGRGVMARLGDRPLRIAEAGSQSVVLEIPDDARDGVLQVELPDGRTDSFALSFGAAGSGAVAGSDDGWWPNGGRA
ncbi:MAG: hypothetical protein ACXW3O_00505 [Brevundimonas sp.]